MSPVTPFNILKHELIGLKAEVKSSTCKYIGIRGEVVDETRNMLYIRTRRGVKAVPKAVCKFVFKLNGGIKVEVEGVRLVGRPEDRLVR